MAGPPGLLPLADGMKGAEPLVDGRRSIGMECRGYLCASYRSMRNEGGGWNGEEITVGRKGRDTVKGLERVIETCKRRHRQTDTMGSHTKRHSDYLDTLL